MEKIKKKLKNVLENKKLLYNLCLVITIGGLLLIVTGTSYAILSGSTQSNKEQVIKAGEVLIEVTEYFESIGSKVSVMSDEEGLLQEDVYNFKIKNIGDVTAKYDVKLINEAAKYDVKLINEVPSSYSDGVIEDKYVKIGLEINGEEHGPFTLEEANNIIDSNIIYKNELVDYNLRIWLNEEYEEELLNMEGYKAFFKVSVEAEQSSTVVNAAKMVMTKAGTDGVVEETHPETTQLAANTDYRYTGADPNNYVSFNNELWRIIGVFPTEDGAGKIENRVKIIRDESIGTYSWDNKASGTGSSTSEHGSNDWSDSALQIVLNEGAYYNRTSGNCPIEQNGATTTCDFTNTGLTGEVKNMISDVKWYLGGTSSYTSSSNGLASHWYTYERGTTVYSGRPTSWTGKVGLMYPSDYGYTTSGGTTTNRETCLTEKLYNWYSSTYNDCKNNNWLYDNVNQQLTLSHPSEGSHHIFYINNNGNINRDYISNIKIVLPTVYLNSNINITGGNGTEVNPYKLS